MSVKSNESFIESQKKLYIEWHGVITQEWHNICGRLKDHSKLFLGLYHYHNLCEHAPEIYVVGNSYSMGLRGRRDRQAFEIFQSLLNTEQGCPTETLEIYYTWYMIGRCYRWGSGVDRDISEALKWFKKAADKRIPGACDELASLYMFDDMYEKAIKVYEDAFNFGHVWAAKRLFRLYADTNAITNFGKAYQWSLKVPKLGRHSRCLLENILATGQFEWTQKYHQYWSRLQTEFITKKTLFGKERSTSYFITFGDQAFLILLISKFRSRSRFKFTDLLTRDVAHKYF